MNLDELHRAYRSTRNDVYRGELLARLLEQAVKPFDRGLATAIKQHRAALLNPHSSPGVRATARERLMGLLVPPALPGPTPGAISGDSAAIDRLIWSRMHGRRDEARTWRKRYETASARYAALADEISERRLSQRPLSAGAVKVRYHRMNHRKALLRREKDR